VPERLADRLTQRFPGLVVVGAWSPPFRDLSASEEHAMLERIRTARPDIVWVGLSTPKQERWMARYADQLRVPVLVGVGAAFDMHAGLKAQAPRWMQRVALEWLFRLCSEPRRLWRRYLINNPWFLWRLFLQSSGLVQYNLRPANAHDSMELPRREWRHG
jgi:N-acetylglucosaminyldiphosphoundecaprenol N-acetyl-beta-D-mannosaminyltransferase